MICANVIKCWRKISHEKKSLQNQKGVAFLIMVSLQPNFYMQGCNNSISWCGFTVHTLMQRRNALLLMVTVEFNTNIYVYCVKIR